MDQETPVQSGGIQPFPVLGQPLHGVLTSLVLSPGTWEHRPEEAASNRSEQLSTAAYGWQQGTLVFL